MRRRDIVTGIAASVPLWPRAARAAERARARRCGTYASFWLASQLMCGPDRATARACRRAGPHERRSRLPHDLAATASQDSAEIDVTSNVHLRL